MKVYGIDPVHFGVVFVVNMEIGYLAPPVATNLFVASALFKKPFGQVSRAVLPGLGLTGAALVVFMFVPTCSKGLVNINRGVAVYESFPWDGTSQTSGGLTDRPNLEALSKEAGDEAAADAEKLDQMGDDYYFNNGDDPTALPVELGDGDAGTPVAGDGDSGVGDAGVGDAGVGDGDAGAVEPDELDGVQL